MKILIKSFFVILISICLFSCGKNLPTNKILEYPYYVKSIEEFYSSKQAIRILLPTEKGLCKYYLSTGTDYAQFRDNISVIDSIGKFKIGDSVTLSLNKFQ